MAKVVPVLGVNHFIFDSFLLHISVKFLNQRPSEFTDMPFHVYDLEITFNCHSVIKKVNFPRVDGLWDEVSYYHSCQFY